MEETLKEEEARDENTKIATKKGRKKETRIFFFELIGDQLCEIMYRYLKIMRLTRITIITTTMHSQTSAFATRCSLAQ